MTICNIKTFFHLKCLINTNQLQPQLGSMLKQLKKKVFCVGMKPAVPDFAKQSSKA